VLFAYICWFFPFLPWSSSQSHRKAGKIHPLSRYFPFF
jgi:hypothetical protein